MPSPLGLVDFTTPNFNQNFSGIPTSYTTENGSYKSLITRGSKFYYRPVGESNIAVTSQTDKLYGSINDGSVNDIHNIKLDSVISYCQQEQYPGMYLAAVDFAYLTDLGVYPNNRLVICRRFPSPAPNDLTVVKMRPLSTLVSWYADEFPVKVDFGEEWVDSEGDFVKTLDEMFNLKSIGGGISAVTDVTNSITPLPGLSEGLQLEILKRLGYTDADSKNLPQGNPNLINRAKNRKVGDGSGLKSTISFNFKTRYEQKFINNIDPELMFLDLIGNILRFGTSKSEFYITGKGGSKIREFFNKTFSGDFIGAITIIIDTIIDALKAFVTLVVDATKKFGTTLASDGPKTALTDLGSTLVAPILSKYRVKLGGILSALTGEPSTPWHVTIGNPKKPIFSSGDMLVENVSLRFGDTLSFNDMPSTIEVEFTMSGSRPYGLQEIFDKFSCGAGRSYISMPSNFESQVTGNNNLNGSPSGSNPANPTDDRAVSLTNDQVLNVANNDGPQPKLSSIDTKRVEDAKKVNSSPKPLTPAQQQAIAQANAVNGVGDI